MVFRMPSRKCLSIVFLEVGWWRWILIKNNNFWCFKFKHMMTIFRINLTALSVRPKLSAFSIIIELNSYVLPYLEIRHTFIQFRCWGIGGWRTRDMNHLPYRKSTSLRASRLGCWNNPFAYNRSQTQDVGCRAWSSFHVQPLESEGRGRLDRGAIQVQCERQ